MIGDVCSLSRDMFSRRYESAARGGRVTPVDPVELGNGTSDYKDSSRRDSYSPRLLGYDSRGNSVFSSYRPSLDIAA